MSETNDSLKNKKSKVLDYFDDALDLDISKKSDKNKVIQIIKKWVETDVLRVDEEFDSRQSRNVKIVVSGDNKLVAHD